MTINSAHKLVINKIKTVLELDADRFKFFTHYDETPEFKIFLNTTIKKAVNHFLNMPLGEDGELLLNSNQFGFEKNMISGTYSNIINCVAARAYAKFLVDKKVHTGREKQITDHSKSRPDIVFPELSKPDKKFQNEKSQKH